MATHTVILNRFLRRSYAKHLVDTAPDGAVVIVREKGESRTQAQNRTIHLWYGEIAKHRGDTDALEVKGECHREWGLTIRLRDPVFAWIWEKSGAGLPYEKQCKLLASGALNISSGMSVEELSEYMEGMSRRFRSEGVRLTDPELRKYEGEAA